MSEYCRHPFSFPTVVGQTKMLLDYLQLDVSDFVDPRRALSTGSSWHPPGALTPRSKSAGSLTRVRLVCRTPPNSFCCFCRDIFVFPCPPYSRTHNNTSYVYFRVCCSNRYVLCYCNFPAIIPSRRSRPVVLFVIVNATTSLVCAPPTIVPENRTDW